MADDDKEGCGKHRLCACHAMLSVEWCVVDGGVFCATTDRIPAGWGREWEERVGRGKDDKHGDDDDDDSLKIQNAA